VSPELVHRLCLEALRTLAVEKLLREETALRRWRWFG